MLTLQADKFQTGTSASGMGWRPTLDLEARGYRLHDSLVDFFNRFVAFNQDDAVRIAEGDFPIFTPNTGIKAILLELKSVFILAGLGVSPLVATPGSGEGRLEPRQEQDRKIGLEIAADKAVQLQHRLRTNLTPSPLIGLRRVRKAITENDFAGIERGQDHLGDNLCAVGEHEGHLRLGRETRRARVEDQSPDAVAGGCTAGLTGKDGFK